MKPAPTSITITELHRNTWAVVQRCTDGDVFVITRYGKPVAVLRKPDEALQRAPGDPLSARQGPAVERIIARSFDES